MCTIKNQNEQFEGKIRHGRDTMRYHCQKSRAIQENHKHKRFILKNSKTRGQITKILN